MIKKIIKKIAPRFLLNWYYQFLPFLGSLIYRFPSRKVKIIGVTGTNGKSSTVELITSIFQEAGIKVASTTSIRFQINDKIWKNKLKMTMPGRFKIQKFLRQAVNQGCKHIILEVTSEGIKQHRHKMIDFDTAVFTNLDKEHIESHGSFENYKKEKLKLFKLANTLIVNLDNEHAESFLNFDKNKITYSINQKSDYKGEDIELMSTYSSFKTKDKQFKTNLLGEFNIYNSLAAIAVCRNEGIDMAIIQKALGNITSIAGRMELVIDTPFKAYVDYAHTPDALESVYKTIKQTEQGRMICVLGSCGGGRDKWKRKEFGQLASQYCDEIILTNEDPYDEDPSQIVEDISEHTTKDHKKIIDRKEAIKEAVSIANDNDVVIITGKGSEPWMVVKDNKKIPWDDREIVKSVL
jgi:UDP-N-acetylmuramoyl-L-alanyl-D-glutamate--2,6-diaminopimelate ligase